MDSQLVEHIARGKTLAILEHIQNYTVLSSATIKFFDDTIHNQAVVESVELGMNSVYEKLKKDYYLAERNVNNKKLKVKEQKDWLVIKMYLEYLLEECHVKV